MDATANPLEASSAPRETEKEARANSANIPAPSVGTPAPSFPTPTQEAQIAIAKPKDAMHVSRWAVIAVHGVGSHRLGSSAEAMATVLFNLKDGTGAPRYSPFVEEQIYIPLQPVRMGDEGTQRFTNEMAIEQAPESRRWFTEMFEEPSTAFASAISSTRRGALGLVARTGDTGMQFMRLLLKDYKSGAAGTDYAMRRLRGRRLVRPTAEGTAVPSPAGVDIYEVEYADLARPRNSLLSFLLAFYQLMLHLASLSRLSLDTGAKANEKWRIWKLLRGAQRWTVRALALPVPVLNVMLVVALAGVLPSLLSQSTAGPVAIALAGLMGIAIGAALAWRVSLRVPRRPFDWALRLVVVAGSPCALVGWLMAGGPGIHPETILALEGWLIGLGLLWLVLSAYDEVRNGAKETGAGLWVILFMTFLYGIGVRGQNLEQASVTVILAIVACLRVSWMVFLLLAWVTFLIGSCARWQIRRVDPKAGARARAAIRTSRMALALPSLLLLLFSSFAWAGTLVKLTTDWGKGTLFAKTVVDLSSYETLNWWLLPPNDYHASTVNYLNLVLVWAAGPGLSVTLALALIAFLLLAWWILHSVTMEIKPPARSQNRKARHAGEWISRGLDGTAIVTAVLWTAIFGVDALFLVLWKVAHLTRMEWTKSFFDISKYATRTLLLSEAGKVAISLTALGLLMRYTNSALGAALDVDTYLRSGPADATPRAKIMERYVSLLRYVAIWRDGDGRHYDGVVIVAHSLGTLVTADLLRFLKATGDPALEPMGYGRAGGSTAAIQMKFMSMGSPLRQLLNRFFPYLYDWMCEVPDNGAAYLPPALPSVPGEQPAIGAHQLPDPRDLGVTAWVNMYRSGDYVGRPIWTGEWYNRNNAGDKGGDFSDPMTRIEGNGPGARSEMCMGMGAHTHYWDYTAPDVARELDAMIS